MESQPTPRLILVDMDGVLADQHQGFIELLKHRAPEVLARWDGVDRHYDFELNFPEHDRAFIRSLREEEGFFRDLPLINGAKEAITALEAQGHHVRVCTAPIWNYRYCIPEKFAWIERHFGHELAATTIVSRDKTLVRGDVLIDDKEAITGARDPEWTHLLFDRPYNKSEDSKQRIDWMKWRTVLETALNR